MTEGFQVPLVAWTLGVHTLTVEGPPAAGTRPGEAPNVVLQTRAQTNATLLPILHSLAQRALHLRRQHADLPPVRALQVRGMTPGHCI